MAGGCWKCMCDKERQGCKNLQIRAGEVDGVARATGGTSVWMRLVCTRTDGQCTGPIPWQVKAHSELPSPTTMVTRVLETDEMRPLECRRGTQWRECLAPTARYIVARIALLPIPREGSRLGGFLRRRRPVTTLPGQGLPCLIRTRPGECQGQPEVSGSQDGLTSVDMARVGQYPLDVCRGSGPSIAKEQCSGGS